MVPALGAPLKIVDIPVPVPSPDQVLVQIEMSGLCHTDIHAARGDWPVKTENAIDPWTRGGGHCRGHR